MLYIGNNEIKKIYLGETDISSGYVGTVPFWGGEEPPVTNKARLVLSDSTVVEIPFTGAGDTVLSQDEISAYQSDIAQVEVYSGVTEIGDNAFEACFSLTSVTLPNTLTTIGQSAFNSTPLQSIVITNSVTSIGGNAFEYCGDLSAVTLPNSITTITNSCFSECSSLESIDIPASVTTIEQYAFHNNALTSITIPSAVTTIGTAAFKGGQSLQSIEVECTYPPALLKDDYGDWGYAFDDTNDAPIFVLCDSVDVYKAAEGWSDYEARISCQRTIINPNFDVYYQKQEGDETDWQIFNSGLISLIDKIGVYNDDGECEEYDIPSDGKLPYATLTAATVQKMGFILKTPAEFDVALFQNTDFWEIDGILTTAPWTRVYNSAEESIVPSGFERLLNLPDTVQRVEDYACAGFVVSLPDGQGSFEMNRLPSACTYIGDYAFESAKLMNDDSIPFEIPARITHIGEFAFEGAYLPKTINFNATVGVPDEFMFQVPFYISNVNIAEGNTSIGAGAFHSGAIKDFSLPSTLRTIGDDAFYGVGLTDGESEGSGITIPAGVTTIGDYAFKDAGIPAIYFNGATPPTIGTDVFTNCNAEPDVPTPIYVPCSAVDTYKTAWAAWANQIQCMPEPDPSTEYFHFISLSDGSQVKANSKFQYSLDGGNTWTAGDNAMKTINSGDTIYFKGINSTALGANAFDLKNGALEVRGNIMSLVYGDLFKQYSIIPADNFFSQIFSSARLTKADKLVLPATTMVTGAYQGMFINCGLLQTAPELPATNLADSCYKEMFQNCTSLTTAPTLAATILTPHCYEGMFASCSSLTTAPELPATTLVNCCYTSMFLGCSSLTAAPELPATELASSCYYNMFAGCRSLTTAPELPATTLTGGEEYRAMFSGCTGITQAPELPATALTFGCYDWMFADCTSLITPPELPATTLADGCYAYMFSGCTSLQTAPELPATELTIECYLAMFKGCTSLQRAPELPALTIVKDLGEGSYYAMFEGCSSLNYVRAMFTTEPTSALMGSWLSGVFPAGTFVKNSAATWDNSLLGLPNAWTVETAEP